MLPFVLLFQLINPFFLNGRLRIFRSLRPAFITLRQMNFLPGPDMILVLGAGIQYGMPGADGSIQPVPYVGAARILKCV